jgi:hypothetical protein
LRVLGGAGAALLRVRCRAGRWAAPRGVDAAAAVLPVVGRAEPARGCLRAQPTGVR